MTKDDILRLAREAGFNASNGFSALIVRHSNGSWIDVADELEAFANLVAAHKAEVALAEAYRCGYEAGVVAEREECAKLIEEYPYWIGTNAQREIAAAIRARNDMAFPNTATPEPAYPADAF